MKLEEFIDKAIGVPFLDHGRDYDGWDCWGIVVKAFQECFGKEVQSYDNISALSAKEVADLFDSQKEKWEEISTNKEKPGDVVLLRHGRWPCHVGLVVKRGFMLHADMDLATCVESYNYGILKNKVMGIYRYE